MHFKTANLEMRDDEDHQTCHNVSNASGQNKIVWDMQVPCSFQNAETGAQWKMMRITCMIALQATSMVPHQQALTVSPKGKIRRY